MVRLYHFCEKYLIGNRIKDWLGCFFYFSGLNSSLFLHKMSQIDLWNFSCFFLTRKFKSKKSMVKDSFGKDSGIQAIVGFDFDFCKRQKCVISRQNWTFLATVLLCNTSMDKMFVQQVNRVHTQVILQNFLYI